jgi:uncharacterized protein (DUF1499 family)
MSSRESMRWVPRSGAIVTPHAEFTSRFFGFVDPVARKIHLRSAARLGYSDFGANRRRSATLRAAFVTPNGRVSS